MASSTLFIAVQCFRCSTMQVKQQRKSSNKWNCVVCNSKQSVQKVHAQGYMAKDVRKFVQSFNMSRKFADDAALLRHYDHEDLSLPRRTQLADDNHDGDDDGSSRVKKILKDWSQYIQPEEEEYVQERGPRLESQAEGLKVVTELPEESWKKRKTKKGTASGEFGFDECIASHAAVSSRRNQHPSSQGLNCKRPRLSEVKDQIQNAKQPNGFAPTAGQQTSKWSEYLTDDEELCSRHTKVSVKDGYLRDTVVAFTDKFDLMGDVDTEITPTDGRYETVEENIHPDFA
ncbi:hypothetical protein Dimus_005169 [Dionaea muscipula]